MDTAALQKIYEKHHGKKLWILTDICAAWRARHPNYVGCKHIDYCENFNIWLLSIMSGHDPSEFIDDVSGFDPDDPKYDMI